MYLFNVRTYGILVTEDDHVLISDERFGKVSFTKFPGGGLEYGEGLLDALKREYFEECAVHVEISKHIYTTDFYEKSSFNESQILSIYYQVQVKDSESYERLLTITDQGYLAPPTNSEKEERFRLVPLSEISAENFTFKTDKEAWNCFIKQLNENIR